MAVNIRQLKNELNTTSEQMIAAGRSLGIDVSNYGRNLNPQEEQRLRQYFTGGQQQAAQQAPTGQPGETPAIHAAGKAISDMADTMALGYAAGFPQLVIGRTMQYLNTQSANTIHAQLADRTGQSVGDRDWNESVQEAFLNPFLQQLNNGLEGFSFQAIEAANPLLPSQNLTAPLLQSAAESESSAAPASSPTSVEPPQASESSLPQS